MITIIKSRLRPPGRILKLTIKLELSRMTESDRQTAAEMIATAHDDR